MLLLFINILCVKVRECVCFLLGVAHYVKRCSVDLAVLGSSSAGNGNLSNRKRILLLTQYSRHPLSLSHYAYMTKILLKMT